MDEIIKDSIDRFSIKLEKAYEEGMNLNLEFCDKGTRKMTGTDIDLYDFWENYSNSKFYHDDSEINLKIISSLEDIIIELFFLWNCEILAPLFIKDGVYYELIKLNREQNLIVKTRIYWERIMNFCYLLIEGNELESKNSKKKKFKNWVIENNFVFLEDILVLIEQYDDAFRTPEVHKFSRIRSAVVKNETFSAMAYALAIMMKFGSNVYPNMITVLQGRTNYIRDWARVEGKLTGFSEIPDWVIKKANETGLIVDETTTYIIGPM